MGYEHEILHPAIALWLQKEGFTYETEVKMPEYGRADFVAHRNAETWIVEAKLSKSTRTIAQVVDYCRQYGRSAIPVIAVPKGKDDEKLRNACDYWKVILLGIDVEIPERHYTHTMSFDNQVKIHNANALSLVDGLRCNHRGAIEEILTRNYESGDSPAYDLYAAYAAVEYVFGRGGIVDPTSALEAYIGAIREYCHEDEIAAIKTHWSVERGINDFLSRKA